MKRFQVVRTHISPYQAQDFISQEREMVNEFPLLSYEILESFQDLPTVLITNTHTELTKLPRELLKETVLIIHPNSGYDHFAHESETWKKIPLVVGHTIRAQAVAEYSIGAMFEGLLELPQHITWDKNRNWERKLLKGTGVWVFGYGHIGKIVADTLATLGMKVTVVDPYVQECPHQRLPRWEEGKLQDAEVVISALSLNPTSENIFGEKFFQHARDNLLFINGARGKLVDEKALREFLLSHPDAFAFLDVFRSEPFGEDWHGFPQVWKTSHIAGVEKNLDDKILAFEQKVLRDFLQEDQDRFFKIYEKELLQNKWMKGVLI